MFLSKDALLPMLSLDYDDIIMAVVVDRNAEMMVEEIVSKLRAQ